MKIDKIGGADAPDSTTDEKMMRKAIDLAAKSCMEGGGPFGAVIVKGGKVISAESNSVTIGNDPTAHAEVNAIRAACRKLKTFDLGGCTIYSSCEPCPMCLGAIYWAGISRLVYGADRRDAERIGFGDNFIYEEIGKPDSQRRILTGQMLKAEAQMPFDEWERKEDKTEY